MEGPAAGLERAAVKAAKLLREACEKAESILVLTNLDADGLCAASIVAKVLLRLDAPFTVRVLTQLAEADLASASRCSVVVLTDLGSGYLDLVSKGLGGWTFILDHHMPQGSAGERVVHLNPHLHGADGAREVSAAGVAYLLAQAFEDHGTLAHLAVVGALGDLQDKNPGRELRGVNQLIVSDAVEARDLEVSEDLAFFGREARPLHRSIATTIEPFLPGLSGDEDAVAELLSKLGIPLKEEGRWRTLSDLSVEEKQSLFAGIVQRLIAEGYDTASIPPLTGRVYTLVKEERWTPVRDGREYASLLNACGRLGRPSLGLAVALGDRGQSFREAVRVVEEYRRGLAEAIERVLSTPGALVQRERYRLARCEGLVQEKMLGAVASMLQSSPLLGGKGVLLAVASLDEKNLKVSARASPELVEKGLNLGRVMAQAAGAVGGMGGGHDAAAGAVVLRRRVEKFLEDVERLLQEQGVSG